MCPLSDDPEFKTVQGPRHYSAARIAILAVAVSFILFGEEVVSASAGARERGMWVWEAKQILASATKTDEFLDFCRRNGIVDIYLALESNPSLDAKQFQIATPQLYHVFLARAHANGVRVEVLIGAPEWAAAKYHPRAMSAVEAVLKFNRQAPGRSCFDGVHLDIEPYVLVGFADLDYRQQLLGEFLDLIAECVARVRTDPHLLLTVDVPWWFYPVLSHERIQLSVSFAGGVKTIGEHLSDLLNTVTLMDYRNRAGGANGIVACATPALTYAARQHKRVVIGLETFQQPGRPFYFAFRLDAASFRNQMRAAGLLGELTFHGYVMAAVADGERIYLGLGISSGPSTGPREPVEAALAKLAALLRAGRDQFLMDLPFLKRRRRRRVRSLRIRSSRTRASSPGRILPPGEDIRDISSIPAPPQVSLFMARADLLLTRRRNPPPGYSTSTPALPEWRSTRMKVWLVWLARSNSNRNGMPMIPRSQVSLNPLADVWNRSAGESVRRVVEAEIERGRPAGEFPLDLQVPLAGVPLVLGGRDMQHVSASRAIARILIPVMRNAAAHGDGSARHPGMFENKAVVV